jgi:UDP-N-acetylglucosamine acyltransferase
MAYAHVPHDASVGDGVTMANSAQVGGHAVIGKDATIGLSVTVHQRLWIGAGSMIGMGSTVIRDVPPFAIATGSPARVTGVNLVRLQRGGYSQAVIDAVAGRLSGDTDGAPLPTDFEQAFREYDERQVARS